MFIVFFLLGLGGTTPLPKIIFSENWQWLTYERFGVWATILLIPLIGNVIVSVKNKYIFMAFSVVTLLLGVSFLVKIINPYNSRITPKMMDLSSVTNYLVTHPHKC